MNKFMDGFSLRAEIIIPILLMILPVIVKIIWSRFSKLSVKKALDKKGSFEDFIHEVVENDNSKRFNNDFKIYFEENPYKATRFLKALNKSKPMITFESKWGAYRETQMKQFVYFLSLSESEQNKYKGA